MEGDQHGRNASHVNDEGIRNGEEMDDNHDDDANDENDNNDDDDANNANDDDDDERVNLVKGRLLGI